MEKGSLMKKKIIWIAGICLLSFLIATCGKSTEEKWQEQYDLDQQYLLEENYEEAIVTFTSAIEIDPNQMGAYIGRGNAYVLSGETEEHLAQALADYQYVLKLDEENAEAYLGIADVYIRQGDYDTALEILNEGLEKNGENEEIAAKIEEIESGNIMDSSGFARRERRYDSEGNLRWYLDFTYDEKGRKTSVTSYTFSGDQIDQVSLEYDEDGHQLVQYWWSDDGRLGEIVCQYDASGDLVREETYDGQELSSYSVYEYDESNGQRARKDYYPDGSLHRVTKYEYNKQGQVIKQSEYDSKGELTVIRTTEYNSFGEKISESGYDAEGKLFIYDVYEYDEKGNLIVSKSYDGAGNLIGSQTYDN